MSSNGRTTAFGAVYFGSNPSVPAKISSLGFESAIILLMPEGSIKAAIYDVDGTMVNSEPLHVSAWNRSLQEHSHTLSDLSPQLQATMAGKKPIVIAQAMVQELHIPIYPEEFLRQKTDIFMHSVITDIKTMPGLVESLDGLKAAGYRFAIGTSGQAEYINLILNKFNLRDYFDVIVTGEEVQHGKPDPEMFLLGCMRLGLQPTECIVIEDATTGIEAAKAAGCLCIALENPNAVPQDLSKADKVITSLQEVTDSEITQLANRRNNQG